MFSRSPPSTSQLTRTPTTARVWSRAACRLRAGGVLVWFVAARAHVDATRALGSYFPVSNADSSASWPAPATPAGQVNPSRSQFDGRASSYRAAQTPDPANLRREGGSATPPERVRASPCWVYFPDPASGGCRLQLPRVLLIRGLWGGGYQSKPAARTPAPRSRPSCFSSLSSS